MIADGLKLLECRGAQARDRFGPTGAGVFGGEDDSIKRRGGGVDIAGDDDAQVTVFVMFD